MKMAISIISFFVIAGIWLVSKFVISFRRMRGHTEPTWIKKLHDYIGMILIVWVAYLCFEELE